MCQDDILKHHQAYVRFVISAGYIQYFFLNHQNKNVTIWFIIYSCTWTLNVTFLKSFWIAELFFKGEGLYVLLDFFKKVFILKFFQMALFWILAPLWVNVYIPCFYFHGLIFFFQDLRSSYLDWHKIYVGVLLCFHQDVRENAHLGIVH